MKASLVDIAGRYNTDKVVHVHYLHEYAHYFGDRRHADLKLLELGIRESGSLLMGRDYIGRGTLAGLDIERVALDDASGQATLLARLSQSNNVKICRDAAFAKPLVIIAR